MSIFKLDKYGFKSEEKFRNTIEHYYSLGLSQREIAERVGCKRHTIIKAFKHFNITTDRNTLRSKCKFESNTEMAKEFEKLYGEGLSQRDIAEQFNISIVSVSKIFKQNNIKSRTNSESLAILQKDIKLSDEEKQVIYGLLLGNGELKRKTYTASLHCSCIHDETGDSLLSNLRRLTPTLKSKRKENRELYHIRTLSYMCLAEMHEKWYEGDTKILPDITITSETCYWWYINYGINSPEAMRLTTTIRESNLDNLVEIMPVKCTWYRAHGFFPTIYIPERKKFIDFIGPCRHKDYAYKWDI